MRATLPSARHPPILYPSCSLMSAAAHETLLLVQGHHALMGRLLAGPPGARNAHRGVVLALAPGHLYTEEGQAYPARYPYHGPTWGYTAPPRPLGSTTGWPLAPPVCRWPTHGTAGACPSGWST